MIYKGYTVKRNERGLCEIIDAQGKVVALMSLVRECKKYIDKAGA